MFPIVWMSLRQSWLLHINAYLLSLLFVFVVYFCLYLLCTRCGFPWRFVWWAVRLSLMAASFHLCTSPILCPQRGRDFRQEQDLFVIFAKCISSGRFFIPCTDFSLILEISLSRIFRHVSFSHLIFCHSWMPFLRFLGYNLESKRYQNYGGFSFAIAVRWDLFRSHSHFSLSHSHSWSRWVLRCFQGRKLMRADQAWHPSEWVTSSKWQLWLGLRWYNVMQILLKRMVIFLVCNPTLIIVEWANKSKSDG